MRLKQSLSPFLLSLLAVSLRSSGAFAQDLSKAEELYKHTDFEGSLRILDKKSDDIATNFLIARDYFMAGDFKKSSDYLLKVTGADPSKSEYFDWLGRAYGRRAETSMPLAAPAYASKARVAFEKAVELDPKNPEALSDLFDYYLEAPNFLGGGYDKAMAIADKTAKLDPAEGYFEAAKLAQKRKEFQTAEAHLRQSVASAPHEIGHLLALARFLANQGRTRESDAVFQEAQVVAPNAPKLWFVRADVLIKQNRNLDEAKSLLQRYVRASVTVDDPPKNEAVKLLKQVGGA